MRLRFSRRTLVILLIASQVVTFLVLRSAASWRPLQVAEPSWSGRLAYSPDGTRVAVCGFAGGEPTLRLRRTSNGALLDAATQKSLAEIRINNPENVLWAPYSQLLVAANQYVTAWDGQSSKALFELAYVNEMAMSPDANWLVAAGQKGRGNDIVLWNLKERCQQWRLVIDLHQVQTALSSRYLCLEGQGMTKEGGSTPAVIQVFDLPSSKATRQFKAPSAYVNDMALSPTQPEVLAVADNMGLSLVNVTTGKRSAFYPFRSRAGALGRLTFSPDGSLLACAVSTSSGGPASDILLFKIGSGPTPSLQHFRTLVGHSAWVTALSFSPDGRMLASGGYDKVLRFWRVR